MIDELKIESEILSLTYSLINILMNTGLHLATAESCSGGMFAMLMTYFPGSSASYVGGVTAYSNEAKSLMLGVPEATLSQHGAVSGDTAAAMASGVRERLGAEVGVSLTGIAGPGGGTEKKPVGLVYCGISLVQPRGLIPATVHTLEVKDRVLQFNLEGTRHEIRVNAVKLAILGLKSMIGP